MNDPLSKSEHSPYDDDSLDSYEAQQLASTRARAPTYERKFKSYWKIGMERLMHMRSLGGPTYGYMICYACEEFHVNSPWGLRASCRSVQNSSIRDHG